MTRRFLLFGPQFVPPVNGSTTSFSLHSKYFYNLPYETLRDTVYRPRNMPRNLSCLTNLTDEDGKDPSRDISTAWYYRQG